MYDETYLAHFGIKGMKWGVRRYRNPDGSLTESGTARYTKSGKKKNPRKMSDRDLQKSSARLHAENQYRRELREEKSNKLSNKIINTVIRAGATYVATYGATKAVDKITDMHLGDRYAHALATVSATIAGLSTWDIKVSTLGDAIKRYH